MNATRWYQLKNFLHRVRGTPQELRRLANMGVLAELRATVYRGCTYDDDGNILTFESFDDLGVVSRRVVTTVGVAWLATAFTNTVEAETLNYHDTGTGTTAEASSQSALVTATGNARVAGTQSTPGSTNIYQSVATLPYSAGAAITEHAIFTASSSGTMFDRSVFSAINVVNGDSIQFTWALTLPAGG